MAFAGSSKIRRRAYSPWDNLTHDLSGVDQSQMTQQSSYTGAEITAFINSKEVGVLDNIQISSSRELVGQYVMGWVDARAFAKGKRVTVGSMTMNTFREHPILYGIFGLDYRQYLEGDLLLPNTAAASFIERRDFDNSVIDNFSVGSGFGAELPEFFSSPEALIGASVGRGLNATQQAELYAELSARGGGRANAERYAAVEKRAKTKIQFADQLPPFDITLVGVNAAGHVSECTIYGVEVSQETFGFSMSDMQQQYGFSFVARTVEPWRNVSKTV